MSSNPSARHIWLLFSLCLLAVVVVFYPTWKSLVGVWLNSETYSHGILIAPISAWLIWRKDWRSFEPSSDWRVLGLVFIALSALVWAMGSLIGANILEHVGVTGIVIGLFPAIFGKDAVRKWLFPIGFLVFMIPAGESLNPILMENTADATVWALKASGIAVFREGLHFALPTGRWSVVEACSGLRYIIAAVVLASIFAYLNFKSLRKKLIFIVAAVAVAIFANYARAYVVVLVGHFSNMKIGTGEDHVYFGWAFFGVVMFAVAWAGMKWADMTDGAPSKMSAGEVRATTTVGAWVAVASVLIIAAAAYIAPSLLVRGAGQVNGDKLVQDIAPDWQSASGVFRPAYKGETYRFEGRPNANKQIDLHLSYFADQNQRGEMITEENVIVSSADARWSIGEQTIANVQHNGTAFAVNQMLLFKGYEKRVVWYWYTVGGHTYTSQTRAKLGILKSVMQGNADKSTLSTVSVPYESGADMRKVMPIDSLIKMNSVAKAMTTGTEKK